MLALKHSFYFTIFSFINLYLLLLSAYAQAWSRYEFIWMWVLAFYFFSFFKIVTMLDFDIKKINFPFLYLFCWAGMNPAPFEKREHLSLHRLDLLVKGILNLLVGIGFIALAKLDSHWYLQSWLLCIGIIFCLHFGIFNCIACFLNLLGFRVDSIMNNPLKASSIKEFWGGRWNLAFHDLVVPIVYKPIKSKWGKVWGIFAVFLFSGLVHEAVISASIWQGFGGPLIYFLLQGFGLYIEEKYSLGKIWMYVIVILPAVLLFHPAFMAKAIYPWIELDIL